MARRTELLSAALWAGLGTAILVASWRMDRLVDRGINPWSAPGLTPGVVGALMVLLALVLAWRALRGAYDTPALDAVRAGGAQDAGGAGNAAPSWRSAVLALLLCLAFAGISLGRGLPFVAEAALFIFVFTTAFSGPGWRTQGRLARGLAQTAVVALAAAGIIAWLFESVFLVRLP